MKGLCTYPDLLDLFPGARRTLPDRFIFRCSVPFDDVFVPRGELLSGQILTDPFAEIVIHPLDTGTRPIELFASRRT